MSISFSQIEGRIRRSVSTLLGTTSFRSWVEGEKGISDGDYIFINNSFIFREGIKTTKNAEYLCLSCGADGKVKKDSLAVATPQSFNVDFKRLPAKAGKPPGFRALDGTIKTHLRALGKLVFVLIGPIDDTLESETTIDHSLFKLLRFSPTARQLVAIPDDKIVVINGLEDPETILAALEAEAQKVGVLEGSLPDAFAERFAAAFERLRDDVCSVVCLPEKDVDSAKNSILGRSAATLQQHCIEYETSLKACGKEPGRNPEAFNNALRLGYNFASDATKFIELLVSICDIKPIILWCTLAEHQELAEAFRALPWAKSKKKPSLERYHTTISGARNRAFHNLLPFQRTLEVDMAGISLQARRLRLFSAYTKKKQNVLEYEDQEIVRILTEFTRAPEAGVSSSFWERNLAVMRATQQLMEATANALMLLRRA